MKEAKLVYGSKVKTTWSEEEVEKTCYQRTKERGQIDEPTGKARRRSKKVEIGALAVS
jgi:hypothetical protein